MVKYSYFHKDSKQWIDCQVVGFNPTTIQYSDPLSNELMTHEVRGEDVKTMQYADEVW